MTNDQRLGARDCPLIPDLPPSTVNSNSTCGNLIQSSSLPSYSTNEVCLVSKYNMKHTTRNHQRTTPTRSVHCHSAVNFSCHNLVTLIANPQTLNPKPVQARSSAVCFCIRSFPPCSWALSMAKLIISAHGQKKSRPVNLLKLRNPQVTRSRLPRLMRGKDG